jgi:hypothetical protein
VFARVEFGNPRLGGGAMAITGCNHISSLQEERERERERERDGVWMWKGKMLLHVEGEAPAVALIIAERTSIGKLWRRRDRADEFAVVSGVRGAAPQEFACHLCQMNKGHS